MKPDTRRRISIALAVTAGLVYAIETFYLRWLFPWRSPERWLVTTGSVVIIFFLLITAVLVLTGTLTPPSHRITPVDDPDHTIRLDRQGRELRQAVAEPPDIDGQPPRDAQTRAGDDSIPTATPRPLADRIRGRRPYWDGRVILVMVLLPFLICYWLIGGLSIWYPAVAVAAILGWVLRNFAD